MLLLAFVLTFTWLKQDIGPVTERYTYDTLAACETDKQQKIAEKVGPDRKGLVVSRTIHADCREQ